ncbi:helix-turn-helix domain-containing protein [Actinacidiphila acidipaludis]|uniref:Helix-turn-helix domain-containing protein n=1 Tax=Actinacidiphila acidipaludis TaxID=2873382 RepID=A0ABS7QD32_9ACTN|nr:helix-turn-helix domain-containing protein [Streptomyces acidipaludis]MBY8881066.1 helix-turn-helix domain-containing protein [Streptomyces acidipaludis]
MGSSAYGRVAVWDVVGPSRPSRLPGVGMAGFRDGGAAKVGQRVIPHPSVMLAVDFGAGTPVVTDARGRQQRGSVVAGLGMGSGGSAWVRGENVACLQVRLSPLLARSLLGVTPAELDGVVALDDVWGPETSRIRERLSETTSWQQRFALLESLLERRYQARASADAEVAWAWRRIVAAGGTGRVEGLAAEVGWSRKRLWSRFGEQIGLPPKRAARLVRFDRAVHRLVAGDGPARVAAEGGYTDQSHLHRDVVAFAGVTPTAAAGEAWLAVDDVAWPERLG